MDLVLRSGVVYQCTNDFVLTDRRSMDQYNKTSLLVSTFYKGVKLSVKLTIKRFQNEFTLSHKDRVTPRNLREHFYVTHKDPLRVGRRGSET